MKILVTGVAGFIGSNLSEELLSQGYEVIGIDNFSYGEKRNISPLLNNSRFKFLEGDVREDKILKDIKADVLVHLASQKIPRYSTALVTLEDNSLMLKNVVRKAKSEKMKLVFASTSDVYGKNPNLPYTETSDLLLGPTTVKRWAYAISKIYGEQYIIANHEEYGLNYTIVRFFGSYGPNQNLTWWGGPQSIFIRQAFEKKPIDIHGDGKQTRTFTFVKDTVNALVRCIKEEAAKNEIFNIASDPKEEVTIIDLAKIIWKLVNGPEDEPLFNYIPYSTFGKYEDVMRRVPSIDKIKNMLGYIPQYSLEDGLKIAIDWQKKIQFPE